MKEYFKKYKFKLVNGVVEPFDRYEEAGYDQHRVPVHIDRYGMGEVHWPLMEKEEDAEKVNNILNLNWASDRLPWARKNSPEEVEYLIDVKLGLKNHFELKKGLGRDT